MTRTFIQTTEFEKNWKELGFTDDDLRGQEKVEALECVMWIL